MELKNLSHGVFYAMLYSVWSSQESSYSGKISSCVDENLKKVYAIISQEKKRVLKRKIMMVSERGRNE